jgi:hypothetical protein
MRQSAAAKERVNHMPENATAPYSELASQYATKVTADLEHNKQEQALVSSEIEALQEKLAGLQRDHAVLVNMREALGLTPRDPAPPVPATTADVPGPRKNAARSGAGGAATPRPAASRRTTSGSGKAKQSRRKKSAADASPTNTSAASQAKAQPKAKAKTATQTQPGAAADKAKADKQPTLVDLVRNHLTGTNEPRSAAEITTALSEAHPQRGVKATVVRNTLENLVARGQAERSKQGSAVYYTAAGKAQEQPSRQVPETSSAATGQESEAAAAATQTS